MVIIGQRSSQGTSVLIRKDKKYIQKQETGKTEETGETGEKLTDKTWKLHSCEGYVSTEQVCSLYIGLCVFAFVFSCFSRSALHRLSFSATHCSTRSLPWPCPQPFQHLPTHSKSCKRKLTFVSPHLIRGLHHYIRRDNYFPIFCLWRGVSLTGIKCLQSTAFFGTFLYLILFGRRARGNPCWR